MQHTVSRVPPDVSMLSNIGRLTTSLLKQLCEWRAISSCDVTLPRLFTSLLIEYSLEGLHRDMWDLLYVLHDTEFQTRPVASLVLGLTPSAYSINLAPPVSFTFALFRLCTWSNGMTENSQCISEYCITRYFRGRKFSRKMNLRYFREKIFTRKYLPAKISSRENFFPRK